MTDHPILDSLSDVQKKAVTHPGGPLLIFAGAGSGKTRVLTHRIAWLIDQGISPYRIFAVTFTNKAAGEMRERVERLLPGVGDQVWVSTFHSACVRILRRDAARIGYDSNFVIYDDGDQLSLLKQIFKDLEIDTEKLDPKYVRSLMDLAKCDAKNPAELADLFQMDIGDKFKKVCETYQQRCRQNNAFDFGDLIVKAVELLEQFEDLREFYHQRLNHILVDEFQDTNAVQYKLLSLLLGEHQNICVVGDDDQSIYHWRGANVDNILDFEHNFADAEVIVMGQNYRSTKIIIEAASSVISANYGRKPKELFTENPMGDRIALFRAEDEYAEGRYVAQALSDLSVKQGLSWSEMAIFYRTNSQSRVFEEALARHGIPFQVIGGMRFYERKEIKDILSYLRVISNPSDSVGVARIINTPPRGIGKSSTEKVADFALRSNVTFLDAARHAGKAAVLTGAASKKVNAFLFMMDGLRADSKKLGLQKLVERIIAQTGYRTWLEKNKTVEALSRIENLEELVQAVGEFEKAFPDGDLEMFLEQSALVADQDTIDDVDNQVKLMTVHTAKGLEFPAVFIVGLEDGLFPHSRSLDDPRQMEEERRLFYVAITRAKKRVSLTSAEKRRTYGGRPNFTLVSRFLADIPEPLLLSESVYEKPPTFIDPYRRPPVQKPEPRRRDDDEIHYEPEYDQTGGADFSDEPVIDYSYDQDPDTSNAPFGGLAVGMHVRHAKYGTGRVVFLEGRNEYATAIVQFDKHGIKTLRLQYAKLIRL